MKTTCSGLRHLSFSTSTFNVVLSNIDLHVEVEVEAGCRVGVKEVHVASVRDGVQPQCSG